ncbi:bifunctional phosphoribosylaminoimidazolecarboxamide formyltransferase/IMP cyclohydrolase [Neoehrlichia mikurensis]|uniref:Bifunctional purine biosynthesis protein PurH n=1 Tax=Neoehrlichia mikurensis TaxID=89586 RepID=A0A9Q9BYI3_9RICK|nr:bifunctional phosphoribosylaminoimidazolecarboxamide formyltransferase/IMP cyclohydrolase [Neoehrlichia mikurensis]QXK91625.1 bifunctional phosphoribosylaminoimidazolecarboxamide formyltransferase/IMP cyclohydrolase [Neoehrlichia mikurensis]QXK92836.1 bifunctional phosphoribosylaminoimidazolecarboxamide formyltransferase/IMP cyclohydrolase [Neoehrlichia mikurensis]QXK93316.1 bifunctional phosphoribosylaminoimidazolecarboxamide formyltransferase/IMP cyclohydrolase [Neoehrlichia mikurensis]UTO
MQIKTALISVYDKTNIIDLAEFLVDRGIQIIATHSTYNTLKEANISSIEISKYTDYPEILNGRVKTLHPKVYAGILNKRNNHEMDTHKFVINNIDLVIVNLYPFTRTVSNVSSTEDDIIEHIDIGGISLLRAAGKNFHHVTVISNINDYQNLKQELINNNNSTTLKYRQHLAKKAFILTSTYDAEIYNWFNNNEQFPESFIIHGNKIQNLRIGENPHQKAALYTSNANTNFPIEQLHGKELSYNNIIDIEAAINIVYEFQMPAVSIIKHNNPCGVAIADNITEAYNKAIACDPRSSFGGIIALNDNVNLEIAHKISNLFIEVVIAPSFDNEALDLLKVKKNIRLLLFKPFNVENITFKSVIGGFLVQERNNNNITFNDFKQVTQLPVSHNTISDLLFAWKVCKHVKSNSIVIARNGCTIGIGAGQMSRIDSVDIAIRKAKDCTNSVLASDGFFPFEDNIILSAKANIIAIVQPGGSIRDKIIIQEADNQKIAMFFTNIRNFYH